MTSLLTLVERKRDGHALSTAEIQNFVRAALDPEAPLYQITAFLMAVYFKGLSTEETRDLTLTMRDSGEVLEFPNDERPLVDKHSTGGVGDKVSLPLAPLLACLGLRNPMISGRGLGITGGTLDKLESIPGFATGHSREKIVELVQSVGCCIVAQTETMVPADKKLYALRDVSGTVPSIPLITASILSKKLAENLDCLVLDVKWGRAAFMKTRAEAEQLARGMVELGSACGTRTEAFLNPMSDPLGRTAGNWLEVVESVECLEGRGPDDLRNLVVECAARLLVLSGKAADLQAATRAATACLNSGAPRRKWDEMLAAQGADLDATAKLLSQTPPGLIREVVAQRSGQVTAADANAIGEVVRDLGGGRLVAGATIRPFVGVSAMKQAGEPVQAGEPLCLLHAEGEDAAAGQYEKLRAAFTVE